MLVICVPVIVWLYQQNATLAYDYDVLLKANENITKQRDQYVKISKNLQEDYDLLDAKKDAEIMELMESAENRWMILIKETDTLHMNRNDFKKICERILSQMEVYYMKHYSGK